jgi:outer membrane protein TolC
LVTKLFDYNQSCINTFIQLPTQEFLRNGFSNYNEVIIARQNLLVAELGRVNDELQQLQATVNLICTAF